MPDEDNRLKEEIYNYFRELLKKIKVSEVMTPDPISLTADTPFHIVPDTFHEHGIRHLPIVDEDHYLVGLITERDLYKIDSPRRLMDGTWYYDGEELDEFILKNVMIKEVVTLQPDDSIAAALSMMARRKYGCIPIVFPDKALCGILTQIDLLKLADKLIGDA